MMNVILINQNVQLHIQEVVQIYYLNVLIIKVKFNVILIIYQKIVIGLNIKDVLKNNVNQLLMIQN